MKSNILRATRQRLRLSQSELSRRATVSRWKLNNFELGGGALDSFEVERIGAVLRKEQQSLALSSVEAD